MTETTENDEALVKNDSSRWNKKNEEFKGVYRKMHVLMIKISVAIRYTLYKCLFMKLK